MSTLVSVCQSNSIELSSTRLPTGDHSGVSSGVVVAVFRYAISSSRATVCPAVVLNVRSDSGIFLLLSNADLVGQPHFDKIVLVTVFIRRI